MASDATRQEKQFSQIIARAWTDEEFKARLLREPAQVLRENGISLPDDVEVRVVENTRNVIHLVIPPRPDGELTEEQLEKVSAASACCFTACDPISCYSF